MLEIQDVTKVYQSTQKKALDKVSFHIDRGEFVALLGQNGAGKSTLINILAGHVKKTEGTVRIGGFDLDGQELSTKRILGVVPQEISFDPFFTVGETLKNQSGYFGMRHNDKTIDRILERLSLADKKNVNTKRLSGGMKRRLLIAKAMVHRPPLLILDEPTAGVDIELRRSMHEFLKELNRDGTTIILTTHYLEEAEKLCDRIIILDRGKKIMDAPKETVMKSAGERISVEFQLDSALDRQELPFLGDYSPVVGPDGLLKLSTAAKDVPSILRDLDDNRVAYSGIRFENKKLEDVFVNLVRNGEGV
jgi:ABC-2 type transport system ATP-binding protein